MNFLNYIPVKWHMIVIIFFSFIDNSMIERFDLNVMIFLWSALNMLIQNEFLLLKIGFNGLYDRQSLIPVCVLQLGCL